ncbi:DUF4153 domain-containing protein [Dokdonia sp. Hel_I_53]|uniref:DUF4153 domain-containing protein n=1 Tax=Dokdonia sp. Hel_I_53 TaxID=1566287 RepID=UPI00119A0388|nr:DUF4153 domain-containing protein [Dokdonia sp. Hel_I_53]TVZ52565.1 uncharacterized protein DUF4153 [Dokdonia sp. Hel_I_53]
MKLATKAAFLSKASAAFKRFPFAIIWAILSTIITIVIIEIDTREFTQIKTNLLLVMSLGVSWLIATQFYIEQYKAKSLVWIKIVVVVLLLLFYITLPSSPDSVTVGYIRWVIFMIAGHLTLFFAPFVTVWHPKAYWNYLGNMMIAIARSALFSGVLYLGLVLAMLAVRYLFDISIKEIRYAELFVVCLGVVNTWVYLSDFPKEIQHNIGLHFHKAIEVFVKFILIPLAALYILILYVYAVKIVLQWELPKGWVSYLIIALAALLFLIQFIMHPVRITHDSSIIRKFQPLSYWLFLPLLFLFYVAIYKRIADYGITESRYFLIVIAIFITGAMTYLIFSRKKQLRYLPMALAVSALLSSFGFWGAFSVSERSQTRQFEQVYKKFKEAKLNSALVSAEDYKRFLSISNFLIDHKALHRTENILGYNPTASTTELTAWSLRKNVMDSLQISVEKKTNLNTRRYFRRGERQVLNISGYDYYKEVSFESSSSITNPQEINDYQFLLEQNPSKIMVTKNEVIILEIPLGTFTQELLERPLKNRDVLNKDFNVRGENKIIAVQLHFDSITLETIESTPSISYMRAEVLLKQKDD